MFIPPLLITNQWLREIDINPKGEGRGGPKKKKKGFLIQVNKKSDIYQERVSYLK